MHRPFEAAVALNSEPGRDDCKRLEDAGATIVFNPPLGMPQPATSSLDAKVDSLKHFADRLIHSN